MGANADTVKDGWDAFAKGDMDTATATTSDSAEIVIPESLPWGGTYIGPDGFRDFLDKLGRAFEAFKATPEKVLGADDNHVIVVAKTKGRVKGGGTVEGSVVWVYQLRDGMIADAESWGDTAQVLQALS